MIILYGILTQLVILSLAVLMVMPELPVEKLLLILMVAMLLTVVVHLVVKTLQK